VSTKELRAKFIELHDELVASGPNENWRVRKKLLACSLRIFRLQVQYEKLKAKQEIHIAFFEGGNPLTANDHANITQVIAMNRQITKLLSDLKKTKARRILEQQ
jgi:hypothetical protein